MDTAEAGQRWSEKANAALDAEMDALYDLLGQEPKFEYKENRTDAEVGVKSSTLNRVLSCVSPPEDSSFFFQYVLK